MIKTETIEINGTKYQHTYSDSGYYIERDGIQYADAVDPLDSGRVYMETDQKIEVMEGEEEEEEE